MDDYIPGGTDVLARLHRKKVGVERWRRLLDKRIGLVLLWQDHVYKTWHAYGQWPMSPVEKLPWWAWDDRVVIMTSAKTMEDAVEQMIEHERVGSRAGLAISLASLALEVGRLAETIRDA